MEEFLVEFWANADEYWDTTHTNPQAAGILLDFV
ncbi:hypothetical protein Natpe_4036 (plasmid) [Natrinema pellirubrum DSM 15624]|uniref:Uncharacterized protein n=1 Tax=Natrinema pellirubrum (strain DSM 15624 / CIP 106293 / JCM 10476 / NCIMB 786 / 157) TaxID=797303 RepID=L0JSG5_NATP1|nr:hypothetical protein Natpe_4036 [Natrinema pellirubrum DSM 15624]